MFICKSNKITILIAALAILFVAQAAVTAYPGSLNIIPCTDIMERNSFRLSYESDGSDRPLESADTEYIYTQFGLTDKLEIGYDIWNVSGEEEGYINAKYLLRIEDANAPAVAVGVWNIGEDVDTAYYAVGSKTFGDCRLHFGAQTQSDAEWAMFGADYKVADKLTLLADWQTGSGRYHSMGVYWQATPLVGVTLYAARNNTSTLRDTTDFIGLNVAYTFGVK